jgi:RNA polymerase sigma-70 factor (ECF subfamily)
MENQAVRPVFDKLLGELRPKLHRYCARMCGSAVDGEDIAQESILSAIGAWDTSGPISNPEAWLFRIAHNASLDFLRRRSRQLAIGSDEALEMIASPLNLQQDRDAAAASIRTFIRLPAQQRSAVVLKDVLGHSLEEICIIVGGSLASAKSALQRGRARLKEIAANPEEIEIPVLDPAERARLMRYVACFNDHDFDSVRAMLAEDVELDLVNKFRAKGRENVGEYLHRYSLAEQWAYAAGLIDGRPAMFVFDRHDSLDWPAYFVAIDFEDSGVTSIKDFLCARYALDGADVRLWNETRAISPPARGHP